MTKGHATTLTRTPDSAHLRASPDPVRAAHGPPESNRPKTTLGGKGRRSQPSETAPVPKGTLLPLAVDSFLGRQDDMAGIDLDGAGREVGRS